VPDGTQIGGSASVLRHLQGSLSVIAVIRYTTRARSQAGTLTTDSKFVIGQGAMEAAIRRLTPAARIPAWSGALYATTERLWALRGLYKYASHAVLVPWTPAMLGTLMTR